MDSRVVPLGPVGSSGSGRTGMGSRGFLGTTLSEHVVRTYRNVRSFCHRKMNFPETSLKKRLLFFVRSQMDKPCKDKPQSENISLPHGHPLDRDPVKGFYGNGTGGRGPTDDVVTDTGVERRKENVVPTLVSVLHNPTKVMFLLQTTYLQTSLCRRSPVVETRTERSQVGMTRHGRLVGTGRVSPVSPLSSTINQ